MGDWVPIDELIAYRWDQAELRLLNKSPDHDEMRRRCWLRRLMWNLRHQRKNPMPKGVYERRPKLISRPEAMSFQQEHKRQGGVVTWTVVKAEDCYVAQPTVGGRTFHCQLQAAELDRLRKLLPPGLTHFPGDGQIVEVWI